MEIDGGKILVAGKALLWFALPLAFALWDLRSLRRLRDRRGTGPGAAKAGTVGRETRPRSRPVRP